MLEMSVQLILLVLIANCNAAKYTNKPKRIHAQF